MRVYLSGPMRGYPNLNRETFAAFAADLRTLGYTVLSPPELSAELRKRHGFIDDVDENDPLTFTDYLREDFRAITTVDALAMLPGWAASTGARAEWQCAAHLAIPRYRADALRRLNPDDPALVESTTSGSNELRAPWPETATEEAQRLVHGARSADYGHPAENDARIAALARALFGWDVQTEDVWQFMVLTKLARERMRPKRDNRVDIAGYAEVGDWIARERDR